MATWVHAMYKVKAINPKVFRGYDIRGVVGEDLDEDVYYTLGLGYGAFLARMRIREVAVGRDNRLSSEKYAKAFIKGLNASGADTHDLGLSLSQIVYFSSYVLHTKGCAIVTASHNPKDFNGLKLGMGYSDTMVTHELQLLRKIIEDRQFVKGFGKNRGFDVYPEYKKQLLKHFNLKKKWKVVVDACNTTSGMFYPDILRSAGCRVVEQNTELDGNFPSGVPDPTEVKVLERLAAGVKKERADIGFAYDTDGDRMAVVDERGHVLWMDTIVALFAKDVLDFMPGAPIVYNSLCSRQVTEAIEQSGGQGVLWKTGHSFIKAKVKESRSPFGGELSGHIFFMDNFYGHDDAAYASLRLLQYLERKNQSLSQAVGKLSKYVSSPEIKFGLSDEIKFEFIDTKITRDFKKEWPDAKFTDIDGIRMDMKEEMAIIRASQNGPYLTVKFEAKTRGQYNKLKAQLRKMLEKYKEVEWERGVNIEALD